jgi:hypothetical protein
MFLLINPCTVRVCGQTEEASAIKRIILIKIYNKKRNMLNNNDDKAKL